MRKRFKIILIVLGILGFLLANNSIFRADTGDPSWFLVALVALALLVLTLLGIFIYNRIQSSATVKWDKKRRRRLGLAS